MHQRWQTLLFLHWGMDPESIQSALPPGLEVDTYDGRAWVGVVPFFMAAVRPRFCPPLPGLSWFRELNVRTYVRDRHGRPGVWFYSLDCEQALACAMARRFFHLNYRDAVMAGGAGSDGAVDFRSRRADGHTVERFRWRPGSGDPEPAVPGSLRHFLVERYRLFAYDEAGGRLLTGEVAHDPYRIVPAEVLDLEVADLFRSNNLRVPAGGPEDAVASRGVRVRVFSVKTVS